MCTVIVKCAQNKEGRKLIAEKKRAAIKNAAQNAVILTMQLTLESEKITSPFALLREDFVFSNPFSVTSPPVTLDSPVITEGEDGVYTISEDATLYRGATDKNLSELILKVTQRKMKP